MMCRLLLSVHTRHCEIDALRMRCGVRGEGEEELLMYEGRKQQRVQGGGFDWCDEVGWPPGGSGPPLSIATE
jgi:hypothetical protein